MRTRTGADETVAGVFFGAKWRTMAANPLRLPPLLVAAAVAVAVVAAAAAAVVVAARRLRGNGALRARAQFSAFCTLRAPLRECTRALPRLLNCPHPLFFTFIPFSGSRCAALRVGFSPKLAPRFFLALQPTQARRRPDTPPARR